MPQLTLKNYFTDENKYLSNSKISDYLKSPHYFYRKHILHEIERKETTAMVLGSAVDYLLAQDGEKPKYVVVERRNLKNPPTDYIEVNQAQYDDIIEVANAVAETEVFKDIDKNFKKQVLLTVDDPVGEYFEGLCGLPDYIKVTDDEIIIVDLKTSRTTDPRKYFYHCQEFGYFRQQGFYQMLAAKTYGMDKKITSYHLVVDKQKDIYNVVLFKLDQKEIDKAWLELEMAIQSIANTKDWSRPTISWSTAITLKDPRDIEWDDEEDIE